jgi:hypothetical protein
VGSDLYKSFLRGLVQHRSPACLTEKRASRSETEIAEGVIVKAFSNELTKLGFGEQFLWPLLRAGGTELAVQLGLEGLGRATGTSNRSMGEVVKDTGVNTLFHGGMLGAGKAIGKMAPGFAQNALKHIHDYASWSDPMSYSAKGRALSEGLGTGLKMLAGGVNKKQTKGLGKPAPLSALDHGLDAAKGQFGHSNSGPSQMSYAQLRRMDPRVISSEYFS